MAPRICYFIPFDQFNENGYIPSVVTEGEAGHSPLIGSGDFAQPWYWGLTYEKACEAAAAANVRLGLTEQNVTEIVASSIGQSIRETGTDDAREARLAELGLGSSERAVNRRRRIEAER